MVQPPHRAGNNNRTTLLRDPHGHLIEIVAKARDGRTINGSGKGLTAGQVYAAVGAGAAAPVRMLTPAHCAN